ncbi:hypothetical protein ACP8HZ_09835 [Francisella noatunensis]
MSKRLQVKRLYGVSLEAAKVILETIKNSGYQVGFKASGGIRDEAQAIGYIKLVEEIMSKNLCSSRYFLIRSLVVFWIIF